MGSYYDRRLARESQKPDHFFIFLFPSEIIKKNIYLPENRFLLVIRFSEPTFFSGSVFGLPKKKPTSVPTPSMYVYIFMYDRTNSVYMRSYSGTVDKREIYDNKCKVSNKLRVYFIKKNQFILLVYIYSIRIVFGMSSLFSTNPKPNPNPNPNPNPFFLPCAIARIFYSCMQSSRNAAKAVPGTNYGT